MSTTLAALFGGKPRKTSKHLKKGRSMRTCGTQKNKLASMLIPPVEKTIVYLYYPCNLDRLRRYTTLSDCFPAGLPLANRYPVFCEAGDAVRYGRFNGSQHIILKIIVPENLIQTNGNRLMLKQSQLELSTIEGYFTSDKKTFMPNHHFVEPLETLA